jgi:haloalkane dehalogenase/tRNA(adenine34) deaminase
MEVLRTPEDRFSDLPDFSWPPCYVESGARLVSARMHYIDVGRRDEDVFLCLHGQPTWSYLYRRFIPTLATIGRVIAPDLIGFGRSDKVTDEACYTFEFHRNTLLDLIRDLDLRKITLIAQDWGAIIGMTLLMEDPDRYRRLVVMNSMLACGDRPLPPGFLSWRDFNRSRHDLDIAGLMKRACPHLSDAECAGYSAPFPSSAYKAGVRRFPELLPSGADCPGASISRKARSFLRSDWRKPVFVISGAEDIVFTPQQMAKLCSDIGHPGPDLSIGRAGHFPQEWAYDILPSLTRWITQTKPPE